MIPRSYSKVAASLSIVAALVIAACGEDPWQPRVNTVVQPAHLTGAAAAALQPDSRFVLKEPTSLNGDKLISPAQARRLAMAYLRTFGIFFRPGWEVDRGAPVELASLTPSPRVYFAQSPYGPLPRSDLHAAARRRLGPYYLVTLLQGGQPAVQVAVSALATDYGVKTDGLLAMPLETGMDFISSGIPADANYQPLTPEEAAELVAQATGARVEDVPELLVPGIGEAPLLARWKVQLDRPVRIHRRDGASAATSRAVFVGALRDARFAVDTKDASDTPSAGMPLRNAPPERGLIEIPLPVRAGQSAAFKVVDLSKVEN